MAIEQLAEEVVNEVANNLEEAAEVTRRLNTAGIGYFAVGLGIGAAVGFYFGHKFNREKIRAEAYAAAEDEVSLLRAIYLEKMRGAAETEADPDAEDRVNESEGNETPLQGHVPTVKPPIEEVVEELGYSVKVPSRERPLPAPVPILDDLPENPVGTSKSMNAGWNYEQELASRTPEAPYVIHQNEFNHSNLNYTKVVYSYYARDDYLTNPENEDRPVFGGEEIVGAGNLKFGHGSDDVDVVYVRNDMLETDMQICRLDKSYEEDVVGLHVGLAEDDGDDDDNADDS